MEDEMTSHCIGALPEPVSYTHLIGGAFGKIVSSMVADVIMPPIGLLVGGVNFTDLKWVLKPAEMVDGKEIAAAVSYTHLIFQSFIEGPSTVF